MTADGTRDAWLRGGIRLWPSAFPYQSDLHPFPAFVNGSFRLAEQDDFDGLGGRDVSSDAL